MALFRARKSALVFESNCHNKLKFRRLFKNLSLGEKVCIPVKLQCLPLLWAKKKDGSQYLTQKTGFNTLFTRVVLVKLGGKFHEKPSKGEEGLWRVAEMATKNAMFIGQPHTQRHLWRKRNGQKLDREVDSSKSLANSNTYLAHNRVQIFFEGSFLFL